MKERDLLLIAGGFVLLAIAGGGAAIAYMGSLSIDQIATVALSAGFTGNDLVTAVAVAMAESGGNPKALGDIGIGQGSFGLWQINSAYHPEYGPDFTSLYDPTTNANAAFAIYAKSGYSFKPWSTFNNGAYAHFVSGVQGTLNA
jgi:hypothetical protein